MAEVRRIGWFSGGAASAIACQMGDPTVIAYCDTGAEHKDNQRFFADVVEAFGFENVVTLKSEKYEDTWDVWEKKSYIAGIDGAPCTGELKVKPRLKFQRPGDIHIFGYTYDKRDRNRAEALRETYPDILPVFPLIDAKLTKKDCRALLAELGLQEPVTYAMGFPNANCIPCGKATSIAYWALMRQEFPAEFQRMARLSRRLGVRLTRLKGERIFIDEIPADQPVKDADVPDCDALCQWFAEEIEYGLDKADA